MVKFCIFVFDCNRSVWTVTTKPIGKDANTVYDGDVTLKTSTQDVVDQWKKYLEDILNPTNLGDGWISGAVQCWISRLGWLSLFLRRVNQRVCSNYREITLLSLPDTVYLGVLERKVHWIVEFQIQEEQCHGNVDQLSWVLMKLKIIDPFHIQRVVSASLKPLLSKLAHAP